MEAVEHRLHGAVFHSYVAPARGSRELCAWRLEVAAGTRGMPHRISREEVFLGLGGEITMTLDGETAVLRPGDVAFAPAGAEICVDNLGDGAATMWVTTSVGLEATTAEGATISPPWVR